MELIVELWYISFSINAEMKLDILWTPSSEFKEGSNLFAYNEWLSENLDLNFKTYDEIRAWSVRDIAQFWRSIWDYYEVISHAPISDVLLRPASGMIGTQWFTGSKLNYAEHIFRLRQKSPAILFQSEFKGLTEVSWRELEAQVASLAFYLRSLGVVKGDRIAAFLPNIPEAIIAFLAVNSIGAIWSSCSPDFGSSSVTDRFQQIEPKVIFVADGYMYNGKEFSKANANQEICGSLSSLEKTIFIPYLLENSHCDYLQKAVYWEDTQRHREAELTFEAVEFDHPLWVLYSSGTTGKPKAITHSNGGNLLEHLKALGLHQNCKKGERFFWYSTTGWMMWNYALASMLHGCTVCLYDGAAAHPDLHVLWDFARTAKINHFGAGASFYIACMKAELDLTTLESDLTDLRSVGSTGSPLPPEAFQWIYDKVKKDLWLISLSGGTDVCSGFVGGNPFDPVCKGEIQCRMLGCDLQAWDTEGNAVINAVGEMILAQPMPSMPVFFWGDEGNQRYQASYFEMYPGIWRHGDWIKISERGSMVIYGRSDATLNRGGVRIGTSEVYSAVEGLDEVRDSLVICLDKNDGSHYMPLFVVVNEDVPLDDNLKHKIKCALRNQFSPRHVPDEIFAVHDIPYTISGKKMEMPVKKILSGMDVSDSISPDAMKNPESLEFFFSFVANDQ